LRGLEVDHFGKIPQLKTQYSTSTIINVVNEDENVNVFRFAVGDKELLFLENINFKSK
jgi:hypothetical protein